ncbi:MAG: RNA polymerase sigma factor [Bacteroidales bacterium]|nr:RNA polymerase sigma factor [Bacteroidales bacterium]
MKTYSDRELMAIFRNGETKNYGFNLMVRKYQKQVYWHIRRMVVNHEDADDLVQDTFIKVWKGLEKFREESKLFTWIYRIATNETLTFLKSKKRMFFITMVDYNEKLCGELEDDNYFNGEEIQRKLQQAILKLPDKQRLVFNMKYYEEIKYDEMSEVLQTSVGALKASYHLAVKKIEKSLKGN